MKGKLLISSVKNTAIYALGNFSVRLIGLVLIPILTNTEFVSLEQFGVFSLLEVGIQLVTAIFSIGLYMGLSRFYWDEDHKSARQDLFTINLLFVSILSAIVLIVAGGFYDQISVLFFNAVDYSFVIQLALWSAAIQATLLVIQTLLKLQSKSGYYSFINIIRSAGMLLFAYILITQKQKSLEGIYIAQVISLLIALLVALPALVKNITFKINWTYLPSLFKYSIPLFISSILGISIMLFDKYILNAVEGLVDVGVYSLGFKLANSLKVFVITSVQLTLSPLLMKAMHDEKHGQLYNRILQLFSLGLMSIMLVVAVFGKEFIGFITANDVYLNAFQIFLVLLVGFYFEMMKDQFVVGLVIEKKTILTGILSFVIAIISLMGYRLVAPIAGAFGIAVVFVGVKFVSMLSIYYFAQKYHPVPYRLLQPFLILIIAVGVYLCSTFLNESLGWINYVGKMVIIFQFPILLLTFKVVKWKDITNWARYFKVNED